MELKINPKFEIRNSKQSRMTKNSKSKKMNPHIIINGENNYFGFEHFKIRIWNLFRISVFGFRILNQPRFQEI